MSSYSPEQYEKDFPPSDKDKDKDKRAKAWQCALDIRKFEIDLYWKRATYFWAFIATSFAGFLAVQASGAEDKQVLSVVLSCVGVVFSLAWVCVNWGSKYWQENWENHVYLLEDDVTGPLFKVVLDRPDPTTLKEWKDWITAPKPYSVSRINQIISYYVSLLWVCLLFYSVYKAGVSIFLFGIIIISALACTLFFYAGKRNQDSFYPKATKQGIKISIDRTDS